MKIKNIKVLVFTILLSLLFSCSKEVSLNRNIIEDDLINYSDRELFEGIFFARGEFSSKLDVLDADFYNDKVYGNMSDEELVEIDNFIDDILELLDRKDENILKNFRDGIQSKDPYVVEDSLRSFYYEYVRILEEVNLNHVMNENEMYITEINQDLNDNNLMLEDFQRREKITTSGTSIETPDTDAVICLTAVVWNVAVVVNVAAAVNVAVGVNAAFALNAAVGVNVAVAGTNTSTSTSGGGGCGECIESPEYAIYSIDRPDDIFVSEALVQNLLKIN